MTYFQRRPLSGAFSIERLFDQVRHALPRTIETKVAISRFPARGLWQRLYNILEAPFRQGDVNHVTGDVHFLSILLRKTKTVLTIHDFVSVHRLRGVRRKVFLFFWYWLPIKRARIVTVVSESARRELLQNIRVPPGRVRVIHDCVSKDFVCKPLKWDSTSPVILHVGSTPNKNLGRLARALGGIACRLRIVGQPTDRQLEALRGEGVIFSYAADLSGDELVREYESCHMLVFASTYEGFGMPIVEAQATGRPVVTGNVFSMPEVAGDGACLVDPFDVASIRAGILRVMNDPLYREQLIARGLENVKRFDVEAIAQQYFSVYQELSEPEIIKG